MPDEPQNLEEIAEFPRDLREARAIFSGIRKGLLMTLLIEDRLKPNEPFLVKGEFMAYRTSPVDRTIILRHGLMKQGYSPKETLGGVAKVYVERQPTA